MPCDRTRDVGAAAPRPVRPGRLLLLSLAPLALLPLAAADAPSWGSVDPPVALSGETVRVTFGVEDASLLRLDVQPRVSCAVTDARGAVVATCADSAALVEVAVQPGSRAYSFGLPAPQAPGEYVVVFEESSALGLPGSGGRASASFHVVAPEPASQTVLPPQDGGASALTDEASPADAARWVASTLAGTGVVVAAAVAGRLEDP
ncbi:MAG TPA: hypothetical protein VHH36_09190 [Candidatus Thermoplasmatota archaeon]|nr:hypothetical protein [Candidatus Thermoplasmatota archaeon]